MKNVLICMFLLAGVSAHAQEKFSLEIGMGLGMSQLRHNTRFENTILYNLYSAIALTHDPDPYPWGEFEKDFGLKQSFMQPRFCFSASLTHKSLPIFILGEAASSTSTYQKMSYAVTVGLGKDFYIPDQSTYFSFHAGYKFVLLDDGFGAPTLVNSIRVKEARDLAATFFGPNKPLGDQTGQLFTIRGGIGKDLGQEDNLRIGVEAYGELDLTDKLKRESRMSNVGIQAYMRFKI